MYDKKVICNILSALVVITTLFIILMVFSSPLSVRIHSLGASGHFVVRVKMCGSIMMLTTGAAGISSNIHTT